MQRADEKQSSALKICCTVGEKDIEKIQKKIQNLSIVELFENLLLLVGEGLFQVLVMPCHVSEKLLHLLRVVSAIFLRYLIESANKL